MLRLPMLWPVLFGGILAFLIGPLLIVCLFSLATNSVVRFPIEGWTLGWFGQLFAAQEFRAALLNSLLIALPTALIAALTGTMAALGLTRWKGRAALPYLSALSLPVMLPPLVIAIGLLVLFVRWLAIPLGIPTVIAGHVLISQPFVALIIAARLASFDQAAFEAARDLGASPWQIFWRITFPQIRTAIIGAGLIAFAISLDEFIITLFTIGSGNTLSTFVWGKMRTALDPSINAIATLVLLFTIGSVGAALALSRPRR
jgi:spermidine/putrescine transport system permease protein